jgi:hypothetical protein
MGCEAQSEILSRNIFTSTVHDLEGEELWCMTRFCSPVHKLVVVACATILRVPLTMTIAVPS